jgi:hypothetical protein
MLSTLRRGPVLWILAAVALFAVGGAAFTAANTTPLSSAGSDTAGTVSGFTISGITYNLNATDPTLVDSVVFTAQSNHAGPWPASLTTLVGRFTTVPAAWYVCTDDAGGAAAGTYVVTCATVGAGFFYDGATAETALTVLAAVEFDTVLVQ